MKTNRELFGDGAVTAALDLYDARRETGASHGAALFATTRGYARAVEITRAQARIMIDAALQARAAQPAGGTL